jgi:hypothetical protein
VAPGVAENALKHLLAVAGSHGKRHGVHRAAGKTLVARGLKQERRYLFVLDGSKALHAAVEKVFGDNAEVQRWRNSSGNCSGSIPAPHAAWSRDGRNPHPPSLGRGAAISFLSDIHDCLWPEA